MKNKSFVLQIISFKDLFEEAPQNIDFYLSGIDRNILTQQACYFCNIVNCDEMCNPQNILWPFFKGGDEKIINEISQRLSKLPWGENTIFSILNIRANLSFFEHVYSLSYLDTVAKPESEININIFKAYLLINENDITNMPETEEIPIEYILLYSQLKHDLYKYNGISLLYLHAAQIVKACILFEYCEKEIPIHLQNFLDIYNIPHWRDYISNLHQLVMLVIKKNNKEDIVSCISLDKEDKRYQFKKTFLEKFCLGNIDQGNEDFTIIKNSPIVRKDDNNFFIISTQFLSEKIFKSLYFTFKSINDSLKDSDIHIPYESFRTNFGYKFTEKTLLNKVLRTSFDKRYKKLSSTELTQEGDPDYYIRNGRKIFLFECKDNLMNKKIIENGSIDDLITEFKKTFVEKPCKKGYKSSAIKQLCCNIRRILEGTFVDKERPRNCIIYPIIVVNHDIYSLPCVNEIVNQWFTSELAAKKMLSSNIKSITLVDMNSLVLCMDLFKDKKIFLNQLIDDYINEIEKMKLKKYPTDIDVINNFPRKFQSFKNYLENRLATTNYKTFGKVFSEYSNIISND